MSETMPIGTLLVKAGIINGADLADAEAWAKRLSQDITKTLIQSGCLTQDMLNVALEAQTHLGSAKITDDNVILALNYAGKNKKSFQDALEDLELMPKLCPSTPVLAQVIVHAKIVPEAAAQVALSMARETNEPIIEILVREGCISPKLVPVIQHTQNRLRDGQQPEQALQELIASYGFWQKAEQSVQADIIQKPVDAAPKPMTPAQQKAAEPMNGAWNMLELFKRGGFFTQADVTQAVIRACKDKTRAPQLFKFLGLADDSEIKAVWSCLALLEEGRLQEGEALAALAEFRETGEFAPSASVATKPGA